MKRTSLRKVSKKRAKENTERAEAKRVVRYRSGGYCEARLPKCAKYGLDFHEILARSQGGSISDPANILHVCRRCHDWITENPNPARERGLVAPRGA